MSDLIKYSIELPINSSVNVLYKRLSTPSGLAEWFADNVNLKNNIYTFFWMIVSNLQKSLKRNQINSYSSSGLMMNIKNLILNSQFK